MGGLFWGQAKHVDGAQAGDSDSCFSADSVGTRAQFDYSSRAGVNFPDAKPPAVVCLWHASLAEFFDNLKLLDQMRP